MYDTHMMRERIAHMMKGDGEMAYDEKMLAEALNENMADDPYGTFVYVFKEICKAAATYSGHMDDYEYGTIVGLAKSLDEKDRFADVMKGMSDEFGIS